MKVRIYEEDYDTPSRSYCTDWEEVTEEQFKLLSRWFPVEVLRDINYYVSLAEDRQKKEDKRQEQYQALYEKKKLAAAKAVETKKRKLLAKLKQELENERP